MIKIQENKRRTTITSQTQNFQNLIIFFLIGFCCNLRKVVNVALASIVSVCEVSAVIYRAFSFAQSDNKISSTYLSARV